MRKVLFSLFFLFHVFVFSQTNPLASDISTAHYKDMGPWMKAVMSFFNEE